MVEVTETINEVIELLDSRRFLHGHRETMKESLRIILEAALASPAEVVGTPPPESHLVAPDTATVASHMEDFGTVVARLAPKLHWKVWQDLGADPSRYNGGYDGWQHGFGQALFGPLPLPQLIEEMKASLSAKAALATTEGSANG